MDFQFCKAMIFDVDGVFTSGDLLVLEDGSLLRTMNTKDGYMVRHAIKNGILLAVITGGTSEGVNLRLRKLGIEEIYSGASDKLEVLHSILDKYQLKLNEVGFLGDDFPDFEVLKQVGFPCCPRDAAPEITGICKYISPFDGGKGAVRDILSKILLSKGFRLY